MRFLVSRTSLWDDKVPPCSEAIWEPYTRIDEREVDNPKKIPIPEGSDGKWWYEEGTNHRVEDGHIKRDLKDEDWFVEIDSLETLTEFIERYGALIIELNSSYRGVPMIEIYDGWRE